MTTLEAALRSAGISCRVEVRERLAVIVPAIEDGGQRFGRDVRLRAIQLASEAGFSHVAVELDPAGATLSRD